MLDDPGADPWGLLLDLGASVVGPMPWWPATPRSVLATAVAAIVGRTAGAGDRPRTRPDQFADAGICLLRTPVGVDPEIWVRCDGGPHGFLSIAAHAHADALSVEVRCAGAEVLVDPGTYCYHGEPKWRSYFRSTLAHNTVEVDGVSQSVEGGPFLWSNHAPTTVDRVEVGDLDVQSWTGHHCGYARMDPPVRHQRTVALDPRTSRVMITDRLTGAPGRAVAAGHPLRLAFHLGPDVAVRLSGAVARLTWPDGAGPDGEGVARALLRLPDDLAWTAHRGEDDPVLGWYSPRFGERVPATSLIGAGRLEGVLELCTVLDLAPVDGDDDE